MLSLESYFQCCTGLSLRNRGWGFSLATKNVALGYFPRKIIKKVESKETLTSCLIPCLLVVNTRQLDVLVTAVVVVRLGIKVTRPLNGPFYFVDFDIIFSHDNTSKVVFKEEFVCPYRIILGSQLTGFPLTGSIFCLLNIINR